MNFLCLLLDGAIQEFPVIPIKEEDIVDTNGAGDAFVGGEAIFESADFLPFRIKSTPPVRSCWFHGPSIISAASNVVF